MSGLLASVCSVAEAELALQTYADVIDCKNPRQGALGALAPELICDIVDRVDGACPVSATTGDLIGKPQRLRRAVQTVADCGVDYVKFGLFEAERVNDCLAELRDLTRELDLIAVCFADHRFDPIELLPMLADSGCRGVMIDTADKLSGSLTKLWPIERIRRFVTRATELGLLCGLAGKLQLDDIPTLLGLGADYLGFRSALCAGDRRSGIDHGALMQVRNALPYGPVTQPLRDPARALH
jgi:dihydroneopterin aldolase